MKANFQLLGEYGIAESEWPQAGAESLSLFLEMITVDTGFTLNFLRQAKIVAL